MTNRLGRRRRKVFGDGFPRVIDRNAKARIMFRARALLRRTTPGRGYGLLTAKYVAVLEALLFGFLNHKDGRCFPGYEKIAERAGCARSTVAEAIKALEMVGLLTWCNRLARIRVWDEIIGWHIRVIRTSNSYTFLDPQPSSAPAASAEKEAAAAAPKNLPPPDPNSPLELALARFAAARERKRATA